MNIMNCASCKRHMHPESNCRRSPQGFVCMACYDRDRSEPRYLRHPPAPDNLEVN